MLRSKGNRLDTEAGYGLPNRATVRRNTTGRAPDLRALTHGNNVGFGHAPVGWTA